jgi:hypothetical protein
VVGDLAPVDGNERVTDDVDRAVGEGLVLGSGSLDETS